MNKKNKDSSMNDVISSTVENAVSESRKSGNIITDLIDGARLVWRLYRDPETPFYVKFLPLVASVAYFLMPVDLIPDVLLGLGQLDDLTLILASMRIFVTIAPDHLVAKHRADLAAERSGKALPEHDLKEDIIIDPHLKD